MRKYNVDLNEPRERKRANGGRPRGGQWLSIHDACVLLGVDPSTLRRWSDSGKVPVFRTPGGHRRYVEADLRRLIGEGPSPRERTRVSRQTLTDRSLSGYEDEYLRAVRERPWFRSYGTENQDEHRRLGRRLVDLAVRYAASAPNAGDRASLLVEGLQIGEHYGRSGADHGLTPAETVEAFLYFRYPVFRAVTSMIEEEELATRRAIRLYGEISNFMDQVLTATVQSHEVAERRARAEHPLPAPALGVPYQAVDHVSVARSLPSDWPAAASSVVSRGR
ncbi:MAG: helix-turn-helix domain-containing protein [Chloroflexia bacterium]|nr:helix-turn-helix domain-containing protein [Chloroflexia bacterium]